MCLDLGIMTLVVSQTPLPSKWYVSHGYIGASRARRGLNEAFAASPKPRFPPHSLHRNVCDRKTTQLNQKQINDLAFHLIFPRLTVVL